MGKLIDLTGRTFTRLKVIKRTDKPNGVKNQHAYWLCKCRCGKEVVADCIALLRGNTKSCGCYSADIAKKRLSKQRGKSKKKNKFIDCGEYYKGYTETGKEFLFDKDMYTSISQYYWGESKGYFHTSTGNTTSKYLPLHHLVMGKPEKGKEIDHINRDPRDNRKQNLRVVSHLENMQNLSKNKTNTTGVSNVYYDKTRKKFFGRFRYNKKIYYSKACDNIKDAEKAVKEKMKEIKKGDKNGKQK